MFKLAYADQHTTYEMQHQLYLVSKLTTIIAGMFIADDHKTYSAFHQEMMD